MASYDRRRRRKRVIDLVLSGIREMGGSGVTAPQLKRFLVAQSGEMALSGQALATALRRAERRGHLVEDRPGRYTLSRVVASRCGCKPKRAKVTSRRGCKPKRAKRRSCRKKKKKAKSACRKRPGIVKRLMRIIFKRHKSKCKCPPKKRRPRGCSNRRRRPRC